jgi:transcriptional regulator with XRE-family HTH domain
MLPRMGKVQPWSEKHGIGRDTVYAIWRGREPQPATLAVIASALGVTYDELLRVRAGIASEPAREGTVSLEALIVAQTEAIQANKALLEQILYELIGQRGRLDTPSKHKAT